MRFLLTVLWFLFSITVATAQIKDSILIKDTLTKTISTPSAKDTLTKKKHSPAKASIRSAIIPGWGQAYNKKYWKIPIVYTAIGIPGYLFFYNMDWYKRTQEAARMIASNDTINYRSRVDPKLYIFFSTSGSLPSLINYRNQFRRNMDYSVLFVLFFWGLNIIDATVDAHLKDFDVGENLTLKITPRILQGNNIAGISFVLHFGNNHSKIITSLR